MIQDDEKMEAAKAVADDLEPYRRLIDLQKQMIELVRQHEKTKGECAALRGQMLEEITRRRRSDWSFRRMNRSMAGRWNVLAGWWKPRMESRGQTNGSFLPSF